MISRCCEFTVFTYTFRPKRVENRELITRKLIFKNLLYKSKMKVKLFIYLLDGIYEEVLDSLSSVEVVDLTARDKGKKSFNFSQSCF